ncbi:hypothetical protein [Promicromonospora sukumoe]|uniref:hypothetical protein n=1 Tax=Promicromonospora sukumoe TaxID=88382 RepID=UPI00035D8028|nr:hypothetical protein [Promicromonospora sukumoe]
MNRTWKVAMDLVDAGGIRRNYPITTTDVARSAPTGAWPERLGRNAVGPDTAVRKIVEELARARSLADQLAARIGRATASSSR